MASNLETKILGDWNLEQFAASGNDLPVNGKDVMRVIGVKGKHVGFALRAVRDYYIMMGLQTPKGSCEEWLKGWWDKNKPA